MLKRIIALCFLLLLPSFADAKIVRDMSPVDFSSDSGFTRSDVSNVSYSNAAFTLGQTSYGGVTTAISNVTSSGTRYNSMAYDGAYLWAGSASGVVKKIDPATKTVVNTVTLPSVTTSVTSVVFDGTNIWATNGNVYKINPSTAAVTTVSMPTSANFLFFDGSSLWVWASNGYWYTINISTNAVQQKFSTYGSLYAGIPFVTPNYIFTVQDSDPSLTLSKFNMAGSLVVNLGCYTNPFYFDGTYLWVIGDNSCKTGVFKINVSTNAVTQISTVTGLSKAYYDGNGYIWGFATNANAVKQIDPSTGSVLNQFSVSYPREGLMVGNALWAINDGYAYNGSLYLIDKSYYSKNTPYYVITPNVDLTTQSFRGLETVSVTQSVPSGTDIRWLVSPDTGSTWYTYGSGAWNAVNLTDIAASGLDQQTLQSLVANEWDSLITGGKVRLAFSLITSSISATPSVSNISMTGEYEAVRITVPGSIYAPGETSLEFKGASGFTPVSISIDYGDGTIFDVEKSSYSYAKKYTTAGVYTITASMVFDTGETDTGSVELSVLTPNAYPTIDNKNLDDGNAPTQYYLRALTTFDSKYDSISSWNWSVTDSSGQPLQLSVDKSGNPVYTASGKSFLPVFSTAGDYTVKLEVTPKYANPTETSTTVTVGTFTLPVITLEAKSPKYNRPTASYTIKATSTMKKDKVSSYSWKITDPDGNVIIPTAKRKTSNGLEDVSEWRSKINYSFNKAGTWTIENTATTKEYGWSLVATKEITVNENQSPVVSDVQVTTYSTGLAKIKIVANDPDGKLKEAYVDLGDGTTSIYREVKHTYAASGTYTVSGWVKDDSGASTSFTKDITVTIQ